MVGVDLETVGVCRHHAPYRAMACPPCLAALPGGYPHQPERLRFVAAARALVGAPFVYRGRSGSGGVDCAGLALCASRDAGLGAPIAPDDYPKVFVGDPFIAAWWRICEPIEIADALPGDIVLFRTRRRVSHAMIVSECGTVIHASQLAGKVTEDRLDGALFEALVAAVRPPAFREVLADG